MHPGLLGRPVRLRSHPRFPESPNVYDSLAEAYAAHGDRQLAVENYEKSLALDPANTNAASWLKKLSPER